MAKKATAAVEAAPTAELFPADAPGYPLGGPVPKTRVELIAISELDQEASSADERAEVDAAKVTIQAERDAAANPPPPPLDGGTSDTFR